MTAGVLVLVGAPLARGAAADGGLSPRATAALADADAVWCDDVDRTSRMLADAGIGPLRLGALDEDADPPAITQVLAQLAHEERVVLVTGADDRSPGAGSPVDSGPGPAGERLVAAVAGAGHTVEVVPGPSTAMAALVVSGLDAGRFVVEGRLPGEGPARRERLATIAAEQRTTVVHETAAGLTGTVADLLSGCGPNRRVAVVPGATSPHRPVWRGTLAEAEAEAEGRDAVDVTQPAGRDAVVAADPDGEDGAAATEARGGRRGVPIPVDDEIVIVIEGATALAPPGDDEIAAAIQAELASGSSTRDAARSVAAGLGVPRRRAYEIATSAVTPAVPLAEREPAIADEGAESGD